MDQLDQDKFVHLAAVLKLDGDQTNSLSYFLNKMINAIAMIAVHGKPDPTPNGKIANKNTTAPTDPIRYTQPFSNMETAINPWQMATNPTASRI